MEEPVEGSEGTSFRAGRRSLGLALLVTLVVLTAAMTAAAQAGRDSIDDLIAKASQQGTLRVIVEVKIDPPGQPRPEAIAQAQDLVLQELTGTRHRIVRRYSSFPLLTLEVSAEALRRLGASTNVTRIGEDVPSILRAPNPTR